VLRRPGHAPERGLRSEHLGQALEHQRVEQRDARPRADELARAVVQLVRDDLRDAVAQQHLAGLARDRDPDVAGRGVGLPGQLLARGVGIAHDDDARAPRARRARQPLRGLLDRRAHLAGEVHPGAVRDPRGGLGHVHAVRPLGEARLLHAAAPGQRQPRERHRRRAPHARS
jgi:hypothetical protein